MASFLLPAETRRLHSDAASGYRFEQVTSLAMPVAIGLMEGGFIAVIASKVFDVHPAVLAIISASPMFANVLSVVWARVSAGRRKVPLIVGLQSTVLLLAGAIALLPASPVGGWLLALCVVLSHLAISGIITLRSTVWTLNYPDGVRARLVGRLILFSMVVQMVVWVTASLLQDWYPNAFRYVYPAGACISIIGLRAFAKVPIVDEAEHLTQESAASKDHATGGMAAFVSAWKVLRDDVLYRTYLGCQFLLGVGNMMVEPPLVYLVSKQWDMSYAMSIALLRVIPQAVQILTITPWTRVIDRVHIAQFRVWQSAFFTSSLFLTGLSIWGRSIVLLAVARVLYGIARGGGGVAWTIGHNDFASPQMATAYMGVHVTLTGVRGAVAPFFGMLLFLGWGASLEPAGLPTFSGIGPAVWGVACVFSLMSGIGFRRLRRRLSSVDEAPAPA